LQDKGDKIERLEKELTDLKSQPPDRAEDYPGKPMTLRKRRIIGRRDGNRRRRVVGELERRWRRHIRNAMKRRSTEE